jgi:hypothetical protein
LEQFLADGLELLDGVVKAQLEVLLVAPAPDGLAAAVSSLDGLLNVEQGLLYLVQRCLTCHLVWGALRVRTRFDDRTVVLPRRRHLIVPPRLLLGPQ